MRTGRSDTDPVLHMTPGQAVLEGLDAIAAEANGRTHKMGLQPPAGRCYEQQDLCRGDPAPLVHYPQLTDWWSCTLGHKNCHKWSKKTMTTQGRDGYGGGVLPLTIYDLQNAGPLNLNGHSAGGAAGPQISEQLKIVFSESTRRGGPEKSSCALVFIENEITKKKIQPIWTCQKCFFTPFGAAEKIVRSFRRRNSSWLTAHLRKS